MKQLRPAVTDMGRANQWATNVFKTDGYFNINYPASNFCSEIPPTLTHMKPILKSLTDPTSLFPWGRSHVLGAQGQKRGINSHPYTQLWDTPPAPPSFGC